MSTQAIVIRPCSECFADLADPDYPGGICGRCAGELIGAEIKRHEAVFTKAQGRRELLMGVIGCMVCAAVLLAPFVLLVWGAFAIGRHIGHWLF